MKYDANNVIAEVFGRPGESGGIPVPGCCLPDKLQCLSRFTGKLCLMR